MIEKFLLVILPRNQVERSTCNFYGKEDGIIKNNCDIERKKKKLNCLSRNLD